MCAQSAHERRVWTFLYSTSYSDCMANDSVSISTQLQHIPGSTSIAPPVNFTSTSTLTSPTKYRFEEFTATAGAPLTIAVSEFTTISALAVWNQDAANAVTLSVKGAGASGAMGLPVGAGGQLVGTVNLDPTTAFTLSTAASTGTSSVYVYVAGT